MLAEFRPGKQRKAEVDSGGVERVTGLIQIHADRIVHIHGPRDANEHLSEIGKDTPVVSFVGVGEIAAGDFPAKAHVVKLAASSPNTDPQQEKPLRRASPW